MVSNEDVVAQLDSDSLSLRTRVTERDPQHLEHEIAHRDSGLRADLGRAPLERAQRQTEARSPETATRSLAACFCATRSLRASRLRQPCRWTTVQSRMLRRPSPCALRTAKRLPRIADESHWSSMRSHSSLREEAPSLTVFEA